MILKSAWQKAYLLVIIGSFFHLHVNAQERQLIKAKESILQKDYTDATERLSKYAEKNGTGAEYQFVMYLSLSRQAIRYEDYQKAFEAYKSCKSGLEALTDAENWCKEISLCDTTLTNEFSSISISALKAIEASLSMDHIEDYLIRFEKSPLIAEATRMRDRMRFDEANAKHTIEGYELYKKQYATIEFVNAAQDSIYCIAYKNAISENTISGMKSFMENYPNSSQFTAAKSRLIDLEWQKAEKIATVAGYKEFIKIYPFSKYEAEAKDAIENLIWESSVKINTVDEYNNYLLSFPQGKYIVNANEKLDDLYWDAMEKGNSAVSIRQFIAARPNSPRINEAMHKLETAIWEIAAKSQSEEDLRGYLKEYPTGVYKQQAESALDQTLYTKLSTSASQEELQAYLKEFPNGVGKDDIAKKLEEIHWKETASAATISAFEGFLAEHPNSSHKKEAMERLDDLKNFILPFYNNNKKYQLYNVAESKFVDIQEYDKMYPTSVKTFIVERAGKFGAISKSGTIIIPLKFDCMSFDGNFYQVYMGETIALMNLKGEELCPHRFSYVYKVNSELYKVSSTEEDGYTKETMMRMNGELVAPFKYTSLEDLKVNDNILGYVARQNDSYYLLNSKMEVITKGYASIQRNYSISEDPKNQYCSFKEDSRVGLMDFTGKIVMNPMYDGINFLNEGYLAVTKGDKYGIVKSDNSVVLPIGRYTGFGLLNSDFVSAYVPNPDQEYGSFVKIFNLKKQKFISETLFDECTEVSNKVVAATKDNRMQLLNEDGKVLATIDEFTNSVEDGYYGTDTSGEGDAPEGTYDLEGNIICYPVVDPGPAEEVVYELPSDSSNYYVVYYNHSDKGRFLVYLDKTFKVISPPKGPFDELLGSGLTFSRYYPRKSLLIAWDTDYKEVLINTQTGKKANMTAGYTLGIFYPTYWTANLEGGETIYTPFGGGNALIGEKLLKK